MAGTAKTYTSSQIILGPADVWLSVAVPSAASRMTLFSDGTPDAIANPSAVHLGLTAAGTTFEYKPESQDFGSD